MGGLWFPEHQSWIYTCRYWFGRRWSDWLFSSTNGWNEELVDMIFFTRGGLCGGGSGETGIVERSIISYLWRIETCTILVKQFITYHGECSMNYVIYLWISVSTYFRCFLSMYRVGHLNVISNFLPFCYIVCRWVSFASSSVISIKHHCSCPLMETSHSCQVL